MELDLSMRELSRKSGVSVSSISLIESGEVTPTVPTAIAICKALGRDFYEIFPDAKP
jgi:transcriptional regulator with XRE-family HTH domain